MGVVTFAAGLIESKHPFVFVARTGFFELLAATGAAAKVQAALPGIIPHIRAALNAKDIETYQTGLKAVHELSGLVGAELTPHLKLLIGQIAKNVAKKALRDQVQDTLAALEING